MAKTPPSQPAQPAQPAQQTFSNYKALIRYVEAAPHHVQAQFPDLTKLLSNDLPLQAALAYSFLRIEQLWNRALWGGLVKIHKADSKFVRRLMDKQHLTRAGFHNLFVAVYGKTPAGREDFEKAESIRDRVIHGKTVQAAELRYAIGEAIDHAQALFQQVQTIGGFNLGDMRGFAAKIEPLDRRTTKWVLKGMGFAVKA